MSQQELSSCWDGWTFGHNKHWSKIGGLLCPLFGSELGPHLTQCSLGRGLPPCQVASWSIQPFGHNTPTSQTDKQGRQWPDSIERTVLETVAQKPVFQSEVISSYTVFRSLMVSTWAMVISPAPSVSDDATITAKCFPPSVDRHHI